MLDPCPYQRPLDGDLSPGRRLVSCPTVLLVLLLTLLAGCSSEANTSRDNGQPDRSVRSAATFQIERESGLDVLLITIDTLRADALGAYGSTRAATPCMDRLAAGGLLFEEARAHNVVTLPSHATILSGLLPQRHGVRDNAGFVVSDDLATLATVLKKEGYRTGAFVSAFPLDSRFGLDRGFDVYEDSFVGVVSRQAFLEQERPGTETIELAARWLADPDPKPSFAWVHLYEPHYPYSPPEPFAGRFRDDPYAGDVAAADAALAPLLEPIIESAEQSNTLVVLTSDHGESLGEHGEATHGIFGYEGVLRVPLIVYQPRLLPARVVTEPAGLVDVLPTIMDLLDLEVPGGLDGRSLFERPDQNGDTAKDSTYFEALSGQLNRGWAPLYGIVDDAWKYIDLPIPELYDLSKDPGEQTNLAGEEPVRMRELESVLGAFRRDDGRPAPSPVSAETRRQLASLGYLSSGEQLIKKSYTEADDPKRLIVLDAALREIVGLHAAGRFDEAAARAKEIVRERPDMRVAHIQLAQIERDRGNLDGAIAAMQAALSLSPDDATALAMLTSYLTQTGRAEEAAKLTESYVQRERPDTDVLFTRALALARTNRTSEALETLATADLLDPTNPMILVYRGTVLLMAGDRDGARSAYQEALSLHPGTFQASTALAIMATEEGRTSAAVEHWRTSIALDPGEAAKLFAIAGRIWQSGGQTQARPLLELFASTAPEDRFGRELAQVRAMLRESP